MGYGKLVFMAVLLVALSYSNACELTEEYVLARNEFTKTGYESFDKCKNSYLLANYWFQTAQCFERGEGKNTGGGCAHVVSSGGHDYQSIIETGSFCEIFKPTSGTMKTSFKEYVNETNIQKCK